MQTEEILQLLSDNYKILILGGGIICFISIFLPFVVIEGMYLSNVNIHGIDASLSTTWMFWIFLIVIGGMYLGYFQNYGDTYPKLFLGIGVLLVLMTLFATQIYAGRDIVISISYGFILELIGSLSVAIGGYYFDLNRGNQSPKKSG